MRRTSKYYPLRFIVEWLPPGQVAFVPVAAFDSEPVAIDWAKQCHGNNRFIRYRVLNVSNNEPNCIYRSDANAAA